MLVIMPLLTTGALEHSWPVSALRVPAGLERVLGIAAKASHRRWDRVGRRGSANGLERRPRRAQPRRARAWSRRWDAMGATKRREGWWKWLDERPWRRHGGNLMGMAKMFM